MPEPKCKQQCGEGEGGKQKWCWGEAVEAFAETAAAALTPNTKARLGAESVTAAAYPPPLVQPHVK